MTSKNSSQKTVPQRNNISSAGLAAGPTHFVSPDGQVNFPFGPDHVLANRFRAPASEKDTQTNGISGLSGSTLSASAALARSLASRLRAATDLNGSMEYSLTWKVRVTPAQRPICALRASARRTSGKGCTGWPTPNSGPQNDNDSTWEARREAMKEKHDNGNGFGLTLGMAASLTGWATPQLADGRGRTGPASKNKDLGRDATLAGPDTDSSNAGTGGRGGYLLNPSFSRWLMGFPAAWDCSGATAMQSCLKSRRRS